MQLKLCRAISYAAVAAHADKSGRRKLAAMLVEHEPRSSKQVFFFPLPTFIDLSFLSSLWVLFLDKICYKYQLLFFHLGTSLAEHWRGGYGSSESDWKWWYWPCLPCSVSYLAKGRAFTELVHVFLLHWLIRMGSWEHTYGIDHT